MKDLKFLVALLSLFYPLSSHCQRVPVVSTCGQPQEYVAVTLDNSQHSIAQPEPGKARIYFIQDVDDAVTLMFPPVCPIASIYIDEKWVGANMENSYFAVAVEPGWHDLISGVLSPFPASDPEFDHLVAEPGKVYYFHIRVFTTDSGAVLPCLTPLNSDEAKDLIASYPQATAGLQGPNELAAFGNRSRPATRRAQAAPNSQLALNSEQTKTVRDHHANKSDHGERNEPGEKNKTVHDRAREDHASKARHDSAEPQKNGHDTTDHSTGANAHRRTG